MGALPEVIGSRDHRLYRRITDDALAAVNHTAGKSEDILAPAMRRVVLNAALIWRAWCV